MHACLTRYMCWSAGFGIMTTIMIILACGFNQILHISVWLLIVMYALVCFPPPVLLNLMKDRSLFL